MGSTLLSVGINIILAPIFIFWFKWGITGAAVATLLAQVVGMVRVLLHFSDAASTVHFRRGIWQLRKTIVTGILSIGMAPCLVKRLRQRGHRRHQQAACGSRGGPGHRGLRHHQPHSYSVRHARHRPHSGNAAHHRLQPRSHEAGPAFCSPSNTEFWQGHPSPRWDSWPASSFPAALPGFSRMTPRSSAWRPTV